MLSPDAEASVAPSGENSSEKTYERVPAQHEEFVPGRGVVHADRAVVATRGDATPVPGERDGIDLADVTGELAARRARAGVGDSPDAVMGDRRHERAVAGERHAHEEAVLGLERDVAASRPAREQPPPVGEPDDDRVVGAGGDGEGATSAVDRGGPHERARIAQHDGRPLRRRHERSPVAA